MGGILASMDVHQLRTLLHGLEKHMAREVRGPAGG
jgi:hypothetical protein